MPFETGGQDSILLVQPTGSRHALAYVDAPRRLIHGCRVRLLKDGGEAFRAMFEAIETARESVHLETYILRADKTGRAFADRLVAAARRGAEVALLYDSVGSLGLPEAFVQRLREAGVKVLAYHPLAFLSRWRWRQRDHRKVLVVDGEIGFTGGLNIADDYASIEDGGLGWRDTHVRIEGPAALALNGLFRSTWESKGGEPLAPASLAGPPRGRDSVAVVGNTEFSGRWAIRRSFLYAVSQATRYVFITNAYFVPDGGILSALRMARGRGVQVWLMLPGVSDVPVVRWASRGVYARLLRKGVRIFEWRRPVLHAKTVVVDGLWSSVGSYNLDHRSLRHNLEVTAVVPGEGTGGPLAHMFQEDLANCDEIRAEEFARRPLWHRIFERFFYWLRAFL